MSDLQSSFTSQGELSGSDNETEYYSDGQTSNPAPVLEAIKDTGEKTIP